jgi:hypothetical protein
MRNRSLIFGIGRDCAGLREVGVLDTARERVKVLVTSDLCLVKALSAGEYDICTPQQFGFAVSHFLRSALECGQLVHAIEHRYTRLQMARECERHRSVVPKQVIRDPMLGQHMVQKEFLDSIGRRPR